MQGAGWKKKIEFFFKANLLKLSSEFGWLLHISCQWQVYLPLHTLQLPEYFLCWVFTFIHFWISDLQGKILILSSSGALVLCVSPSWGWSLTHALTSLNLISVWLEEDTNSKRAFKCCFLIGWRITLLQHLHVSRAEAESRNKKICSSVWFFSINSSSALAKPKVSPTAEKKKWS